MKNITKTDDLKKKGKEVDENTTSQPDPETIGKTDPQENMKGPVSSLVNKAKDEMEENDEKDASEEEVFEEDEEEFDDVEDEDEEDEEEEDEEKKDK